MEIKKPAIAGTLESGDAQVMVEPWEDGIAFSLDSVVIHQFGDQIKKVTMETLSHMDVSKVRISITDRGALDCTLKARIEGALLRANDQFENLPWGGAIR